MKVIFIRHGEPDYINDSLTDNGKKEAEYVAKRVAKWDVTDFYVSPQGRAQATAAPTLKLLNREALTLPFMREFSYKIKDPVSGKIGVPWDFVPSSWTSCDSNFQMGEGFLEYPCIKDNPEIEEKYYDAINSFDELLKKYGYIRDGRIYRNQKPFNRRLKSTVSPENKVRNNSPYKEGEKEPTIVIFCHLGITCLIMSHLLNIPFETLTHGFYMPPTSVTVLTTEERWDDEVSFRCQMVGDTRHLYENGQKVSPAGLFAAPFQG